MASDTSSNLLDLLTASRTQQECAAVLERARNSKSSAVEIDFDKLDNVAQLVRTTLEKTYPDFQIPPAGFWRVLENGGIDRWDGLASARGFSSSEDLLRVSGDLAILAGACQVPTAQGWVFQDSVSGQEIKGKTALGLALFSMFQSGVFSASPTDPLRVDVDALLRLSEEEVSAGLALGRSVHGEWIGSFTGHLRRFGETVGMNPEVFGDKGDLRPGNLLVKAINERNAAHVELPELFNQISDALAPLWHGAAQEGDFILGDCWRLGEGDAETFVPLHHAVLFISHSLIEPIVWAGVEVQGFDDVPGPSDSLHAHLFMDAGVIKLAPNADSHDGMVSVRAVTSALLPYVAERVRSDLEADRESLPIPCLIGGGTMRAAQNLAMEKPEAFKKVQKIISSGSVFWEPIGA